MGLLPETVRPGLAGEVMSKLGPEVYICLAEKGVMRYPRQRDKMGVARTITVPLSVNTLENSSLKIS